MKQAQTDSTHPLNRKTRVRKGWIHPAKSTLDGNIFYIQPFLLYNQNFNETLDFFIYLFFHSIIEKAQSYGHVDPERRKRLDSESENRKERKTISIPVEEVQWKAFDPEMVSKLARQTSSEELEIYSTFTFQLLIFSLALGSRRWNWKFRGKHFWNPNPKLLLYSSYNL